MRRLATLAVLYLCSHGTMAENVRIAVASNFALPMKVIVRKYEALSGHKVHASFASSGKFYAQIKNGAPFQIFFSADQEKPARLEEEGLSVPGSRFTYAQGALVLWSAKPAYRENGIALLKQGNFNKLALANPRLAPYGAAALATLKNLQLTDATQAKRILGENIAQTYQFVQSGSADLGFVARSQVMKNGQFLQGSGWMVPKHLHAPIKQDAVLLKLGKHSRAARALLNFIQSPAAQEIIESFGYRALSAKH